MRKKSLKKAIASYDKIIREHEEKIKKEKFRNSPNFELVDYWEKEIKSLKENRKKLLG